jgi:hypothetical protein
MYFGCQCSSARSNRLLPDKFTLFGIFSAEIISKLPSWKSSTTVITLEKAPPR